MELDKRDPLFLAFGYRTCEPQGEEGLLRAGGTVENDLALVLEQVHDLVEHGSVDVKVLGCSSDVIDEWCGSGVSRFHARARRGRRGLARTLGTAPGHRHRTPNPSASTP